MLINIFPTKYSLK